MRPFSFFIGIVSQLVPDFWPQVPPTDPSKIRAPPLTFWWHDPKNRWLFYMSERPAYPTISTIFFRQRRRISPYRGPSSGPMDSRKGHPREVWNVGSLIIIHTCRLRVFQWPLYHLGMYNNRANSWINYQPQRVKKSINSAEKTPLFKVWGPEKTEKWVVQLAETSRSFAAPARHTNTRLQRGWPFLNGNLSHIAPDKTSRIRKVSHQSRQNWWENEHKVKWKQARFWRHTSLHHWIIHDSFPRSGKTVRPGPEVFPHFYGFFWSFMARRCSAAGKPRQHLHQVRRIKPPWSFNLWIVCHQRSSICHPSTIHITAQPEPALL